MSKRSRRRRHQKKISKLISEGWHQVWVRGKKNGKGGYTWCDCPPTQLENVNTKAVEVHPIKE